MPIDIETIKSAEVISDESAVVAKIADCHEEFKKRNPMRVAGDPLQTEIRMTDGRPVVAKRGDSALFEAADLATSAIPGAEALKALAEKRGFEWKDGHEDRVVKYFASDARGDRHGDVVDQSWIFDEYAENPIMLFSHDWQMPPVGGTLDWAVGNRKSRGYAGEALQLLTLFADRDTSEHADSLFRLVKAGFLKTGSVGFFPEQVIEVRDREERKRLGLADWGLLYRQNRLVEWSPCSVPANPGAHRVLATAKSCGLLQPVDMLTVRELRRQESLARDEGKTWKRDDLILVGVARNLFPDVTFPEHREVEAPILVRDFAESKPGTTMVSLSSVAEMLEELRGDLSERLGTMEQRIEDAVFEQQQTQGLVRQVETLARKAAGETDDDAPTHAAPTEEEMVAKLLSGELRVA